MHSFFSILYRSCLTTLHRPKLRRSKIRTFGNVSNGMYFVCELQFIHSELGSFFLCSFNNYSKKSHLNYDWLSYASKIKTFPINKIVDQIIREIGLRIITQWSSRLMLKCLDHSKCSYFLVYCKYFALYPFNDKS